jgi:hypothetical protein
MLRKFPLPGREAPFAGHTLPEGSSGQPRDCSIPGAGWESTCAGRENGSTTIDTASTTGVTTSAYTLLRLAPHNNAPIRSERSVLGELSLRVLALREEPTQICLVACAASVGCIKGLVPQPHRSGDLQTAMLHCMTPL